MNKKPDWHFRAGQSIGGFTVGHRATLNGNPNAAFIVGVCGDGTETRVLLHFPEAQPVDVPEGATSHRFEVSFRAIGSTWTDAATVRPHAKPDVPGVYEFGSAPVVVPKGYFLREEFEGTVEQAKSRFKGEYVVLVQSAEVHDRPGVFRFGVFDWTPTFTRWRHGGWYVHSVRHASGASGCVSNNYPDKKWRIVCDDRRVGLNEPGDFTFPSREAAARAELELVNALSNS